MATKDLIFLSYGRGDVYPKGTDNPVEREAHFTVVERVYKHLQQLNMTPWLDKFDLTADRPFTDSINEAIERSQYMLLFIGQHSMNSEWCAREWKHALKHCVPIVPILLEGDWGDKDIQEAYPTRILSTNGINTLQSDGTPDNDLMLNQISQALSHTPAPLSVSYNAKSLPDWYIERPQYTEALKIQLAVNDKDYKGSNIVGITSVQETAALQGIGGIGKTTLAQALCNDCDVRRAFDQIFWLDVGPEMTEDDVSLLMLTVGSYFNDDATYYQRVQTARVRLQQHFAGKRTLLILDDVWAEGIIDEFSFANVDVRLLVTTRDKSLVEESQAVDKLSETEGLKLLATIFDTRNPDTKKLNDDHRQIVTYLDGYTLAIEIAGKWLKKYTSETPADYLARLSSDEAKLFDSLNLSDKDKDKNLSLSLSLSYNALDEDEQRYFRQLGVLAPASTIDKDFLEHLWEIEDGLRPLQTLLDLGLLDEVDGRYSQHALIRAYARQALRDNNEFEAVFGRYVDMMTGLAKGFDALPMEEWTRLDPYLSHIDYIGDELAALWADEDKRTSDLTELAGEFAYRVTKYVFRRPLAIVHQDTVTLRGMNWLEIGLEVYRQAQNQERIGLLLNEIGVVWDALGDRHRALNYYQQALLLRREGGDKAGEATTLNNIGLAWSSLGEVRKALDYYKQALPIQREVGNKNGEAATLNNIGLAWSSLGEVRKALDYYEQALPIHREVGDKSGKAATLNNIGGSWDRLGDRHKALDYYEQALPLRREVGDKSGEATTLNNMSYIYFQNGDLQRTIDIQLKIIDIVYEMGAVADEALYHFNIAVVYRQMSEIDKAIQHVERGREIMVKHNLPQNAGGTTLAQYDQKLAQFKAQRDGTALPAEDNAQSQPDVIGQLAQMLRTEGEAAVREALKENPPDVIERVMQQVMQRAQEESMRELKHILDIEGESKLREVLQGHGLPDDQIDALIPTLVSGNIHDRSQHIS